MAIFYDSESNAAAVTGVTITENTPAIKRISGIYAYTTGSTFNIAIADIDYLNSDSFPSTQINIQGTEYGLPDIDLTGGDLTGWNDDHDNVNDSYSKADWTINAADYGLASATANVSARPVDWTAGSWVDSSNASIAVDTYTDNSTDLTHDFNTEDDRYTSAWAAWVSTSDLTSYDDNLGLQCLASQLIYPTIDYGSYSPTSGSQPDYSACAGTRTYFFEMKDTGVSHSNGRFTLGLHDILDSDAFTNNYFTIEISCDNISWFDCCSPYLGGALSNGDGCRVMETYSLDTNDAIEFTLGTGLSTAVGTGPSGWGIYCKISWTANISAKYIGSISESTW